MTPDNFVNALKTEVRDTAALDTIAQIRTPSGRRPSDEIRNLSNWFNQLSETDQAAVGKVAAMTAHSAIFGFLCVLDGVRKIEDEGEEGEFELSYKGNGQEKIRLNPPVGDMLHDILNAD